MTASSRSSRSLILALCGAALSLLVLPASASALMSTGNGGWQWLDPQPQGNNLETVAALDAQHAVIGGDSGALLTTSDGGASWSGHDLGIASSHIAALSFVDTSDGWAAVWQQDRNGGLSRDYLSHTSDGGTTWTTESSLSGNASSVDFVDARHGWALGNDPALRKDGVWSTTNGGRTWKFHAVAGKWGFSSIDFVDASHGWAAGSTTIPDDPMAGSTGAIFATSDGGASWHKQPFATDAGQMNTVSFVNANDGWAVGNGSDMGGVGTIVATTNGGATWNPQSAGTDWDLHGITFVDAEHGWLPEGDSVYATTDGGATWTARDAGITVTAVAFADDLHGYAVGPGGAMATSADGGASWQVRGSTTSPAEGLPTPSDGSLVSIRPLVVGLAFPDATDGWAVADRSILATSDGGATWTSQTTDAALMDVSFPDASNGWVVGAGGPFGQQAVILHTSDGGSSWQTQYSGPKLYGEFNGLNSVDSVDADHAWVTGLAVSSTRSSVGATTDGGAHWKFVAVGRARSVLADAVSFVNDKRGWVVCAPYNDSVAPSTILRTTDGGLTWKLQDTTKRQVTLRDIAFVDRLHGWAVGMSSDTRGACIVLTTRNGGRTWSRQNLSCPGVWAGAQVRFADRLHGWVVCGPVIWATVDGGRHWRIQRPGGEVGAVAFVSPSHGWAIADSGDWTDGSAGILTTTTGGFRPGQ
jgi:photosystem II stability/assembly factor-like uncharacterized protein